MKKIIITIILLISVYTDAQTIVNLNADIRGRSCSGGLGICSITGGGSISENKTFGQQINEHSFLLIIERNKISQQEEISLAGKNISELSRTTPQVFTMEDELILNDETTKKLGLENNYNTIPKGTFPLTFDDEKIYIKINVINRK